MNEKQMKEAAALRAAMGRGRDPSGHLAPKLRGRVVAWLAKQVASGTQQRALARSLGIHEASVSLWLRRSRSPSPSPSPSPPARSAGAGAMLAVSVVTNTNRPPRTRTAKGAGGAVDSQSLAIVTPHGYRIEGIDVTTAVEILRGLA